MSALESAKSKLDRALPFETEVKEKNLLIGKLRHEAVILNDHLTKALRQLKRGKQDDNIDKCASTMFVSCLLLTLFRQLISNHFLHFLALERTDPRKFQILQIISALLSWTDGETVCQLPFDRHTDSCRTTRTSRTCPAWCL